MPLWGCGKPGLILSVARDTIEPAVPAAVLRSPALPRQELDRSLLLAVLLHFWLILVLGNAVGTAPPGQGVWGSLTVKLLGRSGGSTESDPTASQTGPSGEVGPVGPGRQRRFGGTVRPEAAPKPEEPGAAELGRWSAVEVPPDGAQGTDPVPAPTGRLEAAEQTPRLQRLEPDTSGVAATRRLNPAESDLLPMAPRSELRPTTPRLDTSAVNTVTPIVPTAGLRPASPRMEAAESAVVPLVREAPVADVRSARLMAAESDVTPLSPADVRPGERRASRLAASETPVLPMTAEQGLRSTSRLVSRESEVLPINRPTAPRPQSRSLTQLESAVTPLAPANSLRPATVANPATARPDLAPVPAAELPSQGVAANPAGAAPASPAAPAASAPSQQTALPTVAPQSPTSVSTGASPNTAPTATAAPATTTGTAPATSPAGTAAANPRDSGGAAATAPSSSAATSPGPVTRGDPSLPPLAQGSSGARPAAGSPEAGSRVGADVATPPSAAASAAPPPLNLSLPRGPMAAARRPGLIELLPQPPELARKKTKLEKSLEEATRADCRDGHRDAGLLAAIPIAVDSVRDKGCKW